MPKEVVKLKKTPSIKLTTKRKSGFVDIDQVKIHEIILKNNLYVPDQFMYNTIVYKTATTIIGYIPIKMRGETIGWAMMWDTYSWTFKNAQEKMRLIGTFVLPQYRKKGKAKRAMQRLLLDYKHSLYYTYNPKVPICFCNTWSQFEPLLAKSLLPKQLIHTVYLVQENEIQDI